MLDDNSIPPPLPTGIQQLRKAAERLAGLATAFGHGELAAAIRDDARRRLDDGRVRAVILGEIKHGKSSLINAVLGEALLPVGVTPTTGAVVAIRVDGERTGTFSLSRTGVREPLERDDFDLLARGKRESEAGHTPELLVDSEHLPATLELIDTPGFNDIARFRAALSRSELPRADVLVLVLDATQVLSRSELGLIRDALAAVGGNTESGARVLLVINRIDLVPQEEQGRIVEHIREGLATILPGPLQPFLTNAKAALREPDSEDAAVQAVHALRDELFALAGEGSEILPARARAAMLRQAQLLGYNAAIEARALNLEQTQIDEEIQAVEQAMAARERDLAELRASIPEAGARIVAASHERQAAYRNELQEASLAQIQKADLATLTQVVPGAIQDAFMDFVQQETERLRSELEQQTRDLFATHGELARRRLLEATMPLGFHGPGLYVEPPAVLIEVGMIALGVVGTVLWYLGTTTTGMVMAIVGPLTTVILREKAVRDARVHAKEILGPTLDEVFTQLDRTVQTVIQRHNAALEEHLMLADQGLGEQLIESLRRARQRLSEHEARLQAITERAQAEAPVDAAPGAEEDSAEAGEEQSPAPDKDAAKADERDREPPLPADQAAARRRERIAVAAQSELSRLENELEALVAELVFLDLSSADPDLEEDDEDDDNPTVIH